MGNYIESESFVAIIGKEAAKDASILLPLQNIQRTTVP